MLYVEIHCPNASGWLDHRLNRIDMLVFSKKHYDSYEPGHYPLQSFGELYRNIDGIPDSPLQSLTDWSISISSVYSHKDRTFQTLDLIYHLEALNEAEGIEFNLIGCNAFLLDDEGSKKIIFEGVVDKVSNSGATTSIAISERLHNPVIEKRAFPLILGESRVAQFIPVEIAKNAQGMDEILLGDNAVGSQLYIYLEKTGEYAEVEFLDDKGTPNTAVAGGKIIFVDTDPSEHKIPLDVDYGSLELPLPLVSELRPDSADPKPVDWLLGISGNEEMVQAWNNSVSEQSVKYNDGNEPKINDFIRLGRSCEPKLRKSHKAGDPLKKLSYGKKIRLRLEEAPVSIAETGSELVKDGKVDFEGYPVVYPYPSYPFRGTTIGRGGALLRGEPSYFLKLSAEGAGSEVAASNYDYPHLTYAPKMGGFGISFSRFSLILPDSIPNAGDAITRSMKFNIYYRDKNRYCKETWFSVGKENGYSVLASEKFSQDYLETSSVSDFSKDIVLFDSAQAPAKYSDTQTVHLNVLIGYHEGALRDEFHLYAVRAKREVEIPYTDGIKLYVRARNAPGASSGSYTIKPAVESLLKAAGARDIIVYDDTGCKTYYGMVLSEAANFRDKLRSLASASATLVRSKTSSFGHIMRLCSLAIESKIEAECTIPLGAILLKNNMADFQMQTPERMDLCTGIEIAWGKNLATGKYDRKTIATSSGICHDDEMRNLSAAERLKWDGIFEQLEKNELLYGQSIKAVENEWIRGTDGAERMALYFLYWLCKPLRKAELGCISERLPTKIDLGVLVQLDLLPGFHEKLGKTAWLVTEIKDDLDSGATKLSLLEAWGVPVVPQDLYLLAEDGQKILTEDSEGIKLER